MNLVNNRCGTRNLHNVLGEGMGQRGKELQECSKKKEENKKNPVNLAEMRISFVPGSIWNLVRYNQYRLPVSRQTFGNLGMLLCLMLFVAVRTDVVPYPLPLKTFYIFNFICWCLPSFTSFCDNVCVTSIKKKKNTSVTNPELNNSHTYKLLTWTYVRMLLALVKNMPLKRTSIHSYFGHSMFSKKKKRLLSLWGERWEWRNLGIFLMGKKKKESLFLNRLI